ncbi:MAG: ATP-binding protein [Caldilineaceae bacterium]
MRALHEMAAFVLAELELRAETARRDKTEHLLVDQTQILSLIALGRPIRDVLSALCLIVERHVDGAMAAVSVLNQRGDFAYMVAPHLPATLTDGVVDMMPSDMGGPSAAAVHLGQAVAISDLMTDPVTVERTVGLVQWQPTKAVLHSLLQENVRACWATPVFCVDGSVVGTLSVYFSTQRRLTEEERQLLHNITHVAGIAIRHERSQEEVVASEERYRQLAENVNDIHALHRPDGSYVWISRSLTAVLGYSVDELQGATAFDLIHPEEVDRLRLDLARIMTGESCTLTYRIRHKDGDYRRLEATIRPVFDETGNITGFQSAARDISHRKKETIEPPQSEKHVPTLHPIAHAILAASSTQEIADVVHRHLPSLVSYDSFSIGEVDAAAQEMVMLASELRFASVFPMTRRAPLSYFNSITSASAGQIYAVTDIRAVESPSPMEQLIAEWGVKSFLAAPLYADDTLVGLLNVTSRRINGFGEAEQRIVQQVADLVAAGFQQQRIRAQLIQAKEQAEESNKLKSAFLTHMSHEIRTPLVSILGFSDVLADEVTGPARRHVDIVRRAGRRLTETLDSVLDLARLESRSMHLHPILLDVVQFVRDLALLFERQAADRGLMFHCNFPDTPIVIEADPGALSRVFNNLLSNALKFTAQGEIQVTLGLVHGGFELSVADSGVGMDSDFIPHIFDAYRQASQSTDGASEGVGLGMTITKHLVDLMDGEISVQSTRGEGSCFTVRLPVRYSGKECEAAPHSNIEAPVVAPLPASTVAAGGRSARCAHAARPDVGAALRRYSCVVCGQSGVCRGLNMPSIFHLSTSIWARWIAASIYCVICVHCPGKRRRRLWHVPHTPCREIGILPPVQASILTSASRLPKLISWRCCMRAHKFGLNQAA